jgi:predicted helicase
VAIDRCRTKTDVESGIVKDHFDWCREHVNRRDIGDLVKRITRVSVETMKIVDSLPEPPL